MALSSKQLAMAWINSKLEVSKISPDREEFEKLNGGELPDKLFEDAKARVFDELAKVKVRFQDYVTKYCD